MKILYSLPSSFEKPSLSFTLYLKKAPTQTHKIISQHIQERHNYALCCCLFSYICAKAMSTILSETYEQHKNIDGRLCSAWSMSDFCVFFRELEPPVKHSSPVVVMVCWFNAFLFTTLRLRVYEYQCLAGVFVKWSDGLKDLYFVFIFGYKSSGMPVWCYVYMCFVYLIVW